MVRPVWPLNVNGFASAFVKLNNCTVESQLPAAAHRESRLVSTSKTRFANANLARLLGAVGEVRSHIPASLPLGSLSGAHAPVMTNRPLALIATDFTSPPGKVVRFAASPLAFKSHTMAVPSLAPETRRGPSTEKSRLRITLRCPCRTRGFAVGSDAFTSQSRTDPSRNPPVASQRLSWLNTGAAQTPPGCLRT